MLNFAETDTNTIDYYLDYILTLVILYAVIMMVQTFLKNRNESANKLNVTLDYYGAHGGTQVVHDVLTKEQKAKRFQYLLASILVKAATWVKAPYMFALFNRVHGFTRTEIGYLYVVDNISALFFGPLLGSLCDQYGRKKFCVLYC